MLKKDKKKAAPAPAKAAATPSEPEAAAQPAFRLTEIMARPEPQRTAAMEKLVGSGVSVYLRSRTGKDVKVRHGANILTVPVAPKPFTAGHAIHLLFVAPQLVEEVSE